MNPRRVAIAAALAAAAGCAVGPGTYRSAETVPSVAALGRPGPVVWLSNASDVDFDDLVAVPTEPGLLEGLFDRIHSLDEAPRVLAPGRGFTPEAEWVLAFERPLPLWRPDLRLDDVVDGLRVRFEGMVEGKYARDLLDEGNPSATPWTAASTGNNFWRRRDAPADDLPGGGPFASIAEWDARMASGRLDAYTIHVRHWRPDGRGCVDLVEPFGEVRRVLFPSEGRLRRVVRAVCDVYYRQVGRLREDYPLVGVNFGAHGPASAQVNCACYRAAISVGAVFDTIVGGLRPGSFLTWHRPHVHGKRRIARLLLEREVCLDDVASIRMSLDHYPATQPSRTPCREADGTLCLPHEITATEVAGRGSAGPCDTEPRPGGGGPCSETR